MIPRKKLQLLLYMLHVFYVFGDEETSSTSVMSSITVDNSTKITNYSTAITDTDTSVSDATISESSAAKTSYTETLYTESEYTTVHCAGITVDSVRNLTIANTTSTSISLTWNPPKDDSCLHSYNLTWYVDSVKVGSMNIYKELAYIISDLDPCTNYTITVQTVSTEDEKGGVQNVSCKTSTRLSAVQNLEGFGLEYGLNVSWDAPLEVNCVEAYSVAACELTGSSTRTVYKNTTYTYSEFSGLEACAKYRVEVIPRSSDGINGTSKIATVNTSSSVPETVQNLNVSSTTGYSVTLTWVEPANSANCVSYYSIETCDSSTNCSTTNSSTTSYTVTSLNPCVNYTFIVTAVGDAGQSNGQTVEATTSAVIPETIQNLIVSSTTGYSVTLTWVEPANSANCVSYYSIETCDSSTNCSTTKSSTTSYTVTSLNPCVNYTFKVSAVGDAGQSNGQTVQATTSAVIPETIQNLIVSSTTGYSVTLTWVEPANSANCVSYYSIETCDSSTNCSTTKSSTTSYTVTSLNPCVNYTFKVSAVGDAGQSNGQTVQATTSAVIPETIQNLIVSSTTGYSVTLTWVEPANSANCVSYYSIETCDSSTNCSTTKSSTTSYTVTSLNPCVNYTFKVSAVGDAGQSNGQTVEATTSAVTPGAPQSLAAEPGDFSLNITWEPPSTGATCITSYRVNVWGTPKESTTATYSTPDTYITIPDLYACSNYTAQVIPVSSTGEGGPGMITGTTAESVTNPPVLHIEPSVTKSTITIGWIVENDMNNCELQSVITICNANSTMGHGYDLIDGQSTDNISTGFNVTVNVTISELSPFTTYTCSAITVNSAGNSTFGNAAVVLTSEDFPSPPTNFNESNTIDFIFYFTWEEPECLPGNITKYEIILNWHRLFIVPNWCPNIATNKTVPIDGSELSYEYPFGMPYSEYSVQIRAKTGAGWGNYSEPLNFTTPAGVPENSTKFTCGTEENANDSNVLNAILSWGLPCSLNGKLELFNVSVYGERDGYNDSFTRTILATEENNTDTMFTNNLGELKAEYFYVFKISAKVFNVNTLGPSTTTTMSFPAGIPDQPSEEDIKLIIMDPTKARRTTTTADILLPLFPDSGGKIQYYAVMLAEEGQYDYAEKKRLNISDGDWPETYTWKKAMESDPIVVYQATKNQWNPYNSNNILDQGHHKAVTYVLGGDSDCKELYCNGPLKPDTWYDVRMRAFTNGGYADTHTVFKVKTDAELNVSLVIGTILGILFLGIGTTVLLLLRRGFLQTVLRKFLHSDMPGNPMPPPFPRKKFISHCQQLADNPGKLSNEYQLLHTISLDLQMPTNIASLQANRRKNRYTDILPYDFSRVKLDIMDNDPATDYINASFINGASGEVEYIACQGPKEETIYDFWRMIDQYNVKIIIMVTQLTEKGKEKCHQYYPNIRENFEYEDIAIRCTMKRDYASYTQRTILLQKENMKRNVMHLHFKDWPDHDVPEGFDSMIDFVQIMRKHILANKGLAVIHCSAGVGRTGTLIALDILMQQIRENKKLDVFGTVYKLRKYRINMVQRESQYAYIYNCVRQALKNPYISKTIEQNLPMEPIYENLPNKNADISSSHTNLVNSMETLKKSSPSASINSMEAFYETGISKPTITNQRKMLSKGLRYSKSTSAIFNDSSKITRKGNYGSHDFPMYDIVRDSASLSSRDSNENNDHEVSRSSTFENLSELGRTRSLHSDNSTIYTYSRQRSSDKDTSI